MPKLNFSGNLRNTLKKNILKLPVIPAGAFSIISDGAQDGRQNVVTPENIMTKSFSTVFYPTGHNSEFQKKNLTPKNG